MAEKNLAAVGAETGAETRSPAHRPNWNPRSRN